MTPLDKLWYTVALRHGGHRLAQDGKRDEIDLMWPPALGRSRHQWGAYLTALVMLVQKAAHGRSGIKLEYNRVLSRKAK